MYEAIILPPAKEDVKEAAHWYNDKQKGLGKRFTQEVRSKIKYVCENPKAIAIRYDKTHCAVLDVFTAPLDLQSCGNSKHYISISFIKFML
jgi:hypothetical protein